MTSKKSRYEEMVDDLDFYAETPFELQEVALERLNYQLLCALTATAVRQGEDIKALAGALEETLLGLEKLIAKVRDQDDFIKTLVSNKGYDA